MWKVSQNFRITFAYQISYDFWASIIENKSVPELIHFVLATFWTVLPLAVDLNILWPVIRVGFKALWGWNSETNIFWPGNRVYTSSFLEELKHREGAKLKFIVVVSIMLQIPYSK